ncbi:hypothetical protein YC2023_094405 [Brassica napus]
MVECPINIVGHFAKLTFNHGEIRQHMELSISKNILIPPFELPPLSSTYHPTSSSPSHHSLLHITPTSSSLLLTEPPLSIHAVQRATEEPGSIFSRTHYILIVGCGFSSLTMYDAKEKLCFFSFDIHRDLNLAGFVPLFD